MGNSDSKLSFRKAVIQLTTKTQPVDVNDDAFWDQFWAENVATIQVPIVRHRLPYLLYLASL